MKRYRMSFAASNEHKPDHPERTARRNAADWDVEFGVFTNRPAMAKCIRLQGQREHRQGDWKACVALSPGEGY